MRAILDKEGFYTHVHFKEGNVLTEDAKIK